MAPASPFRGWEFFGRARRVRENAPDLGAKHSHSAGYGEHLQRRAGAFGVPGGRGQKTLSLSGEGRPVGAFGACEGDWRPGGFNLTWRVRHCDHDGLCAGTVRQAAACAVAGMAVHVGQRAGGGAWGRVVGTFVAMVLVHMVAKVRCLRRCLVPAIGRRRRPDGLERHEHQQKDEQQAAHGQRDSKQTTPPVPPDSLTG